MATPLHAQREAEAQLRRLTHFKAPPPGRVGPLGPEMISFFQQSVQKRHTKLGAITQTWVALVPESLQDHCALVGLTRGSLTVLVDTAAHLYELKQLLLCGLEKQLLLNCKRAGLRKIVLRRGRPNW